MRKVNELKWGSFLSYGQMALSVLIGLAYTPIMIRLLGKSEYGLYNTVTSTIAALGILNLGFNSGYIRYYARYKKEGSSEAIAKLNGMFLIIFSVIGLIALLCGIYLTNHLNLIFNQGLTSEEYKIARVLMILLVAHLTVSFPFSVFTTIISAHEYFIFLKLLSIFETIGSPLVTLPLLLMGYRSIALVTITVVVSVIASSIRVYYVLYIMHEAFSFERFNSILFKDLFSYTGFIAINLIVDQINLNIDNLLLARFKGTAAVAVYAVGLSLHMYYQRLSTSISGVFTPRIHHIVNKNIDNDIETKIQLTNLFTKVGRIQFFLLVLVVTGFIFFGKAFIRFWAGRGYGESYYVALLLMIPGLVPLIQNIGIEVQRALNLHRFRSLFYGGMAVVNLIISIVLCQKYGAVGAAAGTAFATVMANGIAMNIYYHKKCKIDIISFWKSIIKMSIGVAPSVIVGIIILYYVDLDKLYWLLIGIALYTAVYLISMYYLGFNDYERNLFIQPLKRVLKKENRI